MNAVNAPVTTGNAFVNALFTVNGDARDDLNGYYVGVQTLTADGRCHTTTVPADRPDLIAQAITDADTRPGTAGTYVNAGLLGRQHSGSDRPEATDIVGLVGLWAEVDIAGTGHAENKKLAKDQAEALAIAHSLGLAPTFALNSGRGIHAWWLFTEPVIIDDDITRDDAAALARDWVLSLQVRAGDVWLDRVGDLARMMRAGGTLNRKADRRAEIIEHNGTTYELDDLRARLAPRALLDQLTTARVDIDEAMFNDVDLRAIWRKVTSPGYRERGGMPEVIKLMIELGDTKLESTWNRDRPDLGDRSQSALDAAFVGILKNYGTKVEVMVETLMAHRVLGGGDTDKADPNRRGTYYLTRTIAGMGNGSKKPGNEKPNTTTGEEKPNTEPAVTVPDIDAVTAELKALDAVGKARRCAEIIPALIDTAPAERAVWKTLCEKNGIGRRDFDKAIKEAQESRRFDLLAFVENAAASEGEQDDSGRFKVNVEHPKFAYRDFQIVYNRTVTALRKAEETRQEMFSHGETELITVTHGKARPLTLKLLVKELADRINFQTVKMDDKGNIRENTVGVPTDVAGAFLDGADTLGLPAVDRIAHTPFYGPDGVLQAEPGYHAAARTLYVPVPGVTTPRVPTDPTSEDITNARHLIETELLGDFAFAGKADKTNIIAAMLTPIMRPMIGGPTPLHLIDAPVHGSGKGLLTDVTLGTVCGGQFDITPAPSDKREWPKQILASLLGAPAIVMFDNINVKVDSGALASAITAWPNVTMRVIGGPRNARMAPPAVWAGTGNNVEATGEIARRIAGTRLEPDCENPDDRTGPTPDTLWRHPDLRRWATDNRGRLIHALCVLAQAWIAAGQREPVNTPTMGSFEAWTRVIGGILEHAGIDGFLSNRDETRANNDMETARQRQFVMAWAAIDAERAEHDANVNEESEEIKRTNPNVKDRLLGPLEGNAAMILNVVCGRKDIEGELIGYDDLPLEDLGHGSQRSKETLFGGALHKLNGRRFGDWKVRWRDGRKGKVWYLEQQ